MSSDVFELISQGFRYWLVLLGAVIVWRVFIWTLQDHRTYRRVLKSLPDAGLIGEIVNLNTGESQPLPREGVVGSGKACDIRLSGIRRRELEYLFVDGRGVEIKPAHRRHELLLDGKDLGLKAFAAHGSRLALPGYKLRFRLFSGLNAPAISSDILYEPSERIPFTTEEEFFGFADGMLPPDQLPGLNASRVPVYDKPINYETPLSYEDKTGFSDTPQWDVHVQSSEEATIPMPEPQSDLYPWNPEITWQYAVPPPEFFSQVTKGTQYPQPSQPVWENDDQQGMIPVRKRRSKRHEK